MALLFVVFFGATLIGHANQNPILISYNEDKFIELTLHRVKPGNLLSIKDKEGFKLYKAPITGSGTIKKEFDLSTLPNGSYIIELDMQMAIIIFPFVLNDKDAVFEEDDSQTIFKPLTKIKNGHLMVSQLTMDMATLEIKIFREVEDTVNDFELLLSEEIKNTRNINRIYKLSKYEKGKFKVVFNTEGQQFVKYF